MSTSEVGSAAQPATPSVPGDTSGVRGARRLRGFADRWPFRRKLNVLVGVPLAVVAVLLSYLIAEQVSQAWDADSAAQLVRDSSEVAELVDQVETEHQQAILLSVRHEAAPAGARPSASDYRKAQAAVDAQVEKVRDTFGGGCRTPRRRPFGRSTASAVCATPSSGAICPPTTSTRPTPTPPRA